MYSCMLDVVWWYCIQYNGTADMSCYIVYRWFWITALVLRLKTLAMYCCMLDGIWKFRLESSYEWICGILYCKLDDIFNSKTLQDSVCGGVFLSILCVATMGDAMVSRDVWHVVQHMVAGWVESDNLLDWNFGCWVMDSASILADSEITM